MAVYLVTYDLNKSDKNYPGLYETIKRCGNTRKPMESVWFVASTSATPEIIIGYIRGVIDENDDVFVTPITKDYMCYLTDKESIAWLNYYLNNPNEP